VKVLAIAPHPDDETIGAGGTVARHAAGGDEVFLCVVTQAYSPPWSEEYIRTARQQVEAAARVLGIRQTFYLGFPTVKLNTVPNAELTNALQKVVEDVRPDVVYTSPPNDINQDHRVVFGTTLVATRPLPQSSVKRLLCYETGYASRYGHLPFAPSVYVNIAPFLDKKLAAMKCYESELRDAPHPRSLAGLELVARERGQSVGLPAAECFQLVRELV
jgi:LmbE family N-acetylglucosaminyl deacetylase